MSGRIICLLIGYLCGNIVTGEIIARKYTGKSAHEIGTSGNPGMANIMAHVGFKPGIIVLCGDLGKTVVAALLSWLLCGKSLGMLAVLYAGTGATLGHNFPFWMKFHGGKGVATTCAAIFLTSPLWGLLSMIAGMLIVFATQYLCIGGVVIPGVFTVFSFLFLGKEYGIVGIFLTILMFTRHYPAIRNISPGTDHEKVDVLGAIKNKFGK